MDERVTLIRQNLERVYGRIEQAAAVSGRQGGDVRLVVVTKSQPVEVVTAAVQAGARLLGENYPEESVAKIEALKDCAGLEWHMIGHLQSRKARLVSEHFDALHSLDSLHLAGKLERLLAERDRVLPVLLEFNVGGEESKSGWQAWDESRWDDLLADVAAVLALPHLQVRGLMTMPPLELEPEAVRTYFARLRRLRDYLASHFPAGIWNELSMGTSGDYEVAIQEGATYVRIGQAILGSRPPKS